MADLESRVENLEKEIPELRKQINEIQNEIHGSLSTIQNDVVEIKQLMKDTTKIDELKNAIINKDVERNTSRIIKLENNQSKLVWTIIIEVIGVIGAAVMAYLKMS
jgi:predicted  nucleic acid-binding Zn-ribbon protein